MANDRHFSFTITELSILLGKAPVTLRGWERDGLITFPRNSRNDRRFTVSDIRSLLENRTVVAHIDSKRIRLVEAILTLLEIVE
jgi:DNA-binding transcriptional MerR regulator